MNIYVGNLDYKIKSEQLAEAFAAFGEVSNARIITDRETRRSKGFGFVEMPNDEEGAAAVSALDGSTLGARQIKVTESLPKQQ
ncbi:MAG: RNA-binding protein [Bacteroidales bacterium]|jgi:RNA recognition motif-containing protein|nr:RNA-binding protein [Bacteroidales bacterium]